MARTESGRLNQLPQNESPFSNGPSIFQHFQLATVNDFVNLWRARVCRLVADVFTVEKAVLLLSEEYFDDYEVLFDDAKEARSWPTTVSRRKMENGAEAIEIDAIEGGLGLGVQRIRNEWTRLRTRSSRQNLPGRLVNLYQRMSRRN